MSQSRRNDKVASDWFERCWAGSPMVVQRGTGATGAVGASRRNTLTRTLIGPYRLIPSCLLRTNSRKPPRNNPSALSLLIAAPITNSH